MTVTAPRHTWIDQRLDDLNAKVDAGFEKVDADIRELRADMRDLRKEVDGRFSKLEAKFDARFDRLTWILLASAAGIITALIGGSAF